MRDPWEVLTAGPPDADRSVLLLPGGANAARSFNLVMAEPALSDARLVATTMPGNAGAPLSEDVSAPEPGRHAGELVKTYGSDVVVGSSLGATVALDMVLSGQFHGPVVLLGISLTTASESRFFRTVVRASQQVGRWPMALLIRLMPLMARSAKTDPAHKKELIEDLKRNRAAEVVGVCSEYLDDIAADADPAAALAASGNLAVGGPRREGRRRPYQRRAGNTRGHPQRDLGDHSRVSLLPPGRGPAADRRGHLSRPCPTTSCPGDRGSADRARSQPQRLGRSP